MRDMMNHIDPVVAIAPVVVNDGTAQVSEALDIQGFNSATFVIALGSLADPDATWTVVVKEGDDATQGNHTAVADTDLIGTEALAGFSFENDNGCRKIGYRGSKRYVSIEIDDVVANTGSAPMSCVLVRGHPNIGATDNPPQ